MSFIRNTILAASSAGAMVLSLTPGAAFATGNSADCSKVPTFDQLSAEVAGGALGATDGALNGGFGLHMWTTIVNRDGYVCAIAFSGADRDDQWPASRVISAQKASTANSLSTPPGANPNFLDGLALSTANLYASAQGGGTLFGVQFSNPVDTAKAYKGPAEKWGTANDPMVGEKVGGHNVFGGGLALYNLDGELVGALGSSGDTSCKDHNYAWRVRNALNMDFVPVGPAAAFPPGPPPAVADATHPDNIIYDMDGLGDNGDKDDKADLSSFTGFGHPKCGLGEDAISPTLPVVQEVP
ncbi:MAG: heme-binding protein [Gammaproteobacteria bacterium]